MHEQNVDGGGSTSLCSCAPKYFKLVPLSRASELPGLGQDGSRAKQQDLNLVVRCRRNITHMANDKMYSVYWCLSVSIGVYVYHSRRCVVHTAVSLSHHIRQPSLLRHSIGRRSIRMAFPACTYMQVSYACSGLARHNCRSLESVCDRRRRRECSPFHSHIRLWSSIFRMPKATSSTSRRADVFWVPSKRRYRPDGWAAVLRPYTSWRLPSLCPSRKTCSSERRPVARKQHCRCRLRRQCHCTVESR